MRFLFPPLLLSLLANAKLSPGNEELVRRWLPLYWLHSQEAFNPTNFDYYISHMELQDANGNVIDPHPTAETLPIGAESRDLHLNTLNDLSCVHCYDQVLFGLPVDQLKPFAIAKVWEDDCNTIDVKFNTWYAYNYGKDVCLSFDPNGFCLVPRVTFGNHFCDGDNSQIRIQNGIPKYLQLNVHTFGALYKYDNDSETFQFVSGESLDIGDDFSFEIDYPKTVATVNGHPEIFVSNGSHGNWGSEGKHNYLKLFNFFHLDDYTERGTEWKFYQQAEIIDYFDASSEDADILGPDFRFRKFQGKFGNINEIGCDVIDDVLGVCQVSGCGGQPFGGNPTSSHFPSPPECE